MTLLHPALFAAGAACIAIPIIIHLLMHRRRKPVMWGAMRFLVEAYKRQRRKLMVEKWVLLAARCLLVLLLAAAVGRPLLEKMGVLGGSGGRTVYLLIDNGVGSSARDEGSGVRALERHKASARAIMAALRGVGGGGESDRVGVIAMGGPAEGVVLPPSANLGSIDALIDALESTDSRTDIPGAMALAAGMIGEKEDVGRTFVVVLSDFTEGAADLSVGGVGGGGAGGGEGGLGAVGLARGVRVLATEPAARALGNVAITGVEPLRSVFLDSARGGAGAVGAEGGGGGDLVRVYLSRSGEGVSQAGVTSLRARLAPAEGGGAGSTASAAERMVVRWSPGQETAVAVAPVRTEGNLRGTGGAGREGGSGNTSSDVVLIASIDEDAIGADNRWRRPIEVRTSLRVGVVAPIRFGKAERVDKLDPGSWARLALQPAGEGTGIDVTDIEPASLDQARLAGLDAVIIARPDLVSEGSWARVRVFIEGGGLAMVLPPPAGTESGSTHVWGDAMSRGLGVEWTAAREAKSVAGGRVVRGEVVAGGANVLALVEGELDELLGAVNVQRVLPLSPAPEGGQTLLKMEDGTALLWVGEVAKSPMAKGQMSDNSTEGGRGMVVYLGVPLDLESSDLPAKPLMVPLMQELVRQGVGRARGSWQSVAGARPGMPARTAELRALADPARTETADAAGDGSDARIRVDADPGAAVRRAGVYRALDERGASRGVVAVNADARGTRTGVQTRDAVGAWLRRGLVGQGEAGSEVAVTGGAGAAGGQDAIVWIPSAGGVAGAGGGGGAGAMDAAGVTAAVSGVLGRDDRGAPVSLPLLVAALAIALLEVAMARRASHAEMRTERVGGSGVSGGVAA